MYCRIADCDSVCEACGDLVIELIDYAHRKITYLNSREQDELLPVAKDAKQLASQSRDDVLEEQRLNIEFSCCQCALSFTRYIAEYQNALAVGTTTRMLQNCDLIMALIPLIDRPPWIKIDKGAYVNPVVVGYFSEIWEGKWYFKTGNGA